MGGWLNNVFGGNYSLNKTEQTKENKMWFEDLTEYISHRQELSTGEYIVLLSEEPKFEYEISCDVYTIGINNGREPPQEVISDELEGKFAIEPYVPYKYVIYRGVEHGTNITTKPIDGARFHFHLKQIVKQYIYIDNVLDNLYLLHTDMRVKKTFNSIEEAEEFIKRYKDEETKRKEFLEQKPIVVG